MEDIKITKDEWDKISTFLVEANILRMKIERGYNITMPLIGKENSTAFVNAGAAIEKETWTKIKERKINDRTSEAG